MFEGIDDHDFQIGMDPSREFLARRFEVTPNIDFRDPHPSKIAMGGAAESLVTCGGQTWARPQC
jgi:hypothetical protein